ncbi:MAG: hypothetical protein FWH26_11120 [Oscillospiraceae bacterium]|nr:hypothetical protein [Oscillospiraceae bacterium]
MVGLTAVASHAEHEVHAAGGDGCAIRELQALGECRLGVGAAFANHSFGFCRESGQAARNGQGERQQQCQQGFGLLHCCLSYFFDFLYKHGTFWGGHVHML